ncbi:unnamed protein product [Arabidopsis thaliana]|uniref:(thale cress) hypothetical protein n=1 Tax=Arabidopsis thaliana TaxID=3702 RepID=A0A7G2F1E2_ARATH|nr:unnamed protein product [Arabidopsis thaliana]
MVADFTDCRGVIKALSDATVVATMEDHVSCVPLSENIEYTCERFWDELYDDADDYRVDRIKECGVRLMYVSQETEYNQQTTRSEKRMGMTSGTSEEDINLPYGQIVADTGLAALNMELSLGQGEPSSSTSLEGEALCVDYMITEEQDIGISILDPVPDDGALNDN